MSLYGLERRTNFSPFQFDKIYSSRAEMEGKAIRIVNVDSNSWGKVSRPVTFDSDNKVTSIAKIVGNDNNGYKFGNYYPPQGSESGKSALEQAMDAYIGKTISTDDGIYVGRYILISYGEDDFTKVSGTNASNSSPQFVTTPSITFNYGNNSIEANVQDLNIENIIATKSNKYFQLNLRTDLQTYGNSYHNTVWMKVYRNAKEEYIMIAELNAKAPQLGIEVEDPAIKSFTQADSGKITSETTETWQEPYFDLTKSSDLYYTLKMPKTHQYKTGAPEFKEEGFNSDVRSPELASTTEQLANLDAANNKIYWQFFNQEGLLTNNAGTNANGKQLFMNLPAFGQLASILYDLLLGIPYTGDTRPHSFDEFDFSDLLGDFSYEGLLKFLQTLFADGSFGMADWTAPVRAPGYIKNKPYVIDISDNGDRKLILDDLSSQSTVYS